MPTGSPCRGDLKLLTVQIDCVEGLRRNSKCILALHFARLFFQLYILLEKKDQAYVKAALDAVEAYCEGSFSDALPVMLGDRSSELLDFAKIETGFDGRVAPGCSTATRSSPAEGGCEKNHVELRKIPPKGTDFDAFAFDDVAKVCSHLNSYPRPNQGRRPLGSPPWSCLSLARELGRARRFARRRDHDTELLGL